MKMTEHPEKRSEASAEMRCNDASVCRLAGWLAAPC
jgi:hypothetical protein